MAGALQPFDTCDSVLAYFKDQAPEYLIQRVGGGGVQQNRRRRIGDRTYGTSTLAARLTPLAARRNRRVRRRRTRPRTCKRPELMNRTS